MDEFATYYSKVAALCSKTEKCSSEVCNKLVSWGTGDELAEKIIKKLRAEKFIDDARYASFFVKDKFRFNKWGRIKIGYMLRQKKISSEIINQALFEIDEDDYTEALSKILQEKAKKISTKNQYDKKAKLLRFAQSHGFENDLIFQVLSTLQNEE